MRLSTKRARLRSDIGCFSGPVDPRPTGPRPSGPGDQGSLSYRHAHATTFPAPPSAGGVGASGGTGGRPVRIVSNASSSARERFPSPVGPEGGSRALRRSPSTPPSFLPEVRLARVAMCHPSRRRPRQPAARCTEDRAPNRSSAPDRLRLQPSRRLSDTAKPRPIQSAEGAASTILQ